MASIEIERVEANSIIITPPPGIGTQRSALIVSPEALRQTKELIASGTPLNQATQEVATCIGSRRIQISSAPEVSTAIPVKTTHTEAYFAVAISEISVHPLLETLTLV